MPEVGKILHELIFGQKLKTLTRAKVHYTSLMVGWHESRASTLGRDINRK